MESHLKSKDRLEKEWEALCAYQAEPNASTTGLKDGNAKKNRSNTVVACKLSPLLSQMVLSSLGMGTSRRFLVLFFLLANVVLFTNLLVRCYF